MPKDIKEILHKYGHKVTSPRLDILKIFSKDCNPINAEKIYEKLKNKNIDIVTIYRNLTSFHKSGLLRKVDLKKSSIFFELNENHHHHIVCTSCNRIEDFKNPEIEKLLGQIVKQSSQIRYNFKNIKEHSLELFGLCVKCLPAE